LVHPEQIEGMLIVWISVLALIVDVFTAKISHHGAHHNTNMKMVFIHNLADVFGSIGVIVSGLCIVWFDIYSIDGIVAMLIAFYMIFQSVVTFPKVVNILMNAAPDNIDVEQVRKCILEMEGIKDVHHVHVWSISEHNIAMECHVESDNVDIIPIISHKLQGEFGINHCNIQVETESCGKCCDL